MCSSRGIVFGISYGLFLPYLCATDSCCGIVLFDVWPRLVVRKPTEQVLEPGNDSEHLEASSHVILSSKYDVSHLKLADDNTKGLKCFMLNLRDLLNVGRTPWKLTLKLTSRNKTGELTSKKIVPQPNWTNEMLQRGNDNLRRVTQNMKKLYTFFT